MSKRKRKRGFATVVIIVAVLLAGAVLGNTTGEDKEQTLLDLVTSVITQGTENVTPEATKKPEITEAAKEPASEASSTTEPDKQSRMKVHFIDVGQGDSILIESDGKYMLIDAGENDQGKKVVSYLKSQGVETLSYVIGTHPHSDHIGGLDTVIDSFAVEKVILPPVEHTTKTYQDVLQAIADKNLKITKPVVGNEYSLGDASFVIIAPNRDYKDNLNDWSVGIKLTNKDNSFLLCGDAENDAEYDICDNGIDLTADVLKLNHHGSSTSNSEALFEAVKPEYAVICVGKDNDYGHPHKETLKRLRSYKVKYFRTDEQGTIIAESDGTNITWNTKPVN